MTIDDAYERLAESEAEMLDPIIHRLRREAGLEIIDVKASRRPSNASGAESGPNTRQTPRRVRELPSMPSGDGGIEP